MKEIATKVKDRSELELVLRLLTGLGHKIHNDGMSVESFMSQHGNVTTLVVGKYIWGNAWRDSYLSVGDFLLEAAKMKFQPAKSWKIGCRTITVKADKSALFEERDGVTIPKATVKEMLEALS